MTNSEVGGELLANRHRLTGIASIVLREPHLADDIFQQVVVQALEDVSQFRDRSHLLMWALKATRHRAVDIARARRRLVLDETVYELLEVEAAEEKHSELEQRLSALRLCTEGLPAKVREMLRLRYGDELATADIASRLGSTANAVCQALSRMHRQKVWDGNGCERTEARR
jgi:RNA polymerase sigma-70 factor, ECF subfamily